MAQHVHDTAVIERRLRPIYDSLEVGNSKKALQETEKVLKKNPQQQCARALKSLALLRLGRDEESQSFLLELEKEKPYDEATLQVMSFCYREMGKLEKICTMYSDAVKMQPGNEEILSHLFMSYVRINDFKSQQNVALQMYKIKPKNPYYFWAVMSVVLQALRGPESSNKSKSNLLLALAERMVCKLLNENKLDAAQEVQLYLSILQYQEKYEEAFKFLDSPVCVKLYPNVPVMDRIELMKKINKWADVNILLKDLLLENLDRWDYYKEYIHSCVTLYNAQDTTEGADYNFDMCHEFLCQVIEKGKHVRGPYLARLHLHRTMTTNGINPEDFLGDYLELLVEYFRLFGDKPSCSNDLKLFLDDLDSYRHAGFASRLIQDCGISATALPQNKDQMQKYLCALQISRLCGAHAALLSTEHLSALYTALSLHYEHGMNAFGANLLSTDMGPSDSYALLAVYVMYDLAIRSRSSERLIEALCLLHYLLCNSPSNFHAKLLCLQIYHILGCGWGAYKTYDSLEIKHIQLDSMGYLHCSLLPGIGIATMAKHLYETTLKFFTTSYKDSVEYLAMSYKFGSFSKLQEFMDFRERLSNSLHYSLVSVESLLLEIVCFCWTFNQNILSYKNMNIKPEEDRINWDELQDNRDLTVIVKWNPKPEKPEINVQEESFNQDKVLLQIRSLLLRLVSSLIEYSNTYNSDILLFNQNEQTLKLVKDSWSELYSIVKVANYQRTSNSSLVNLLPSRLHSILKIPYEIFFLNLSEFVLTLFSEDKCAKGSADILTGEITKIEQLLCNTVKEHNESEDLIWNRRAVQECIVSCVEILSLTAFTLTVCNEKLLSIINSTIQTNKKNKKKDQTPSLKSPQTVEKSDSLSTHQSISDKQRHLHIINLLKILKTAFNNIDNAIETWQCPIISTSLTESLASMSLNPKLEVLVSRTFKDDHLVTIKELRIIIKEKIKMIKV